MPNNKGGNIFSACVLLVAGTFLGYAYLSFKGGYHRNQATYHGRFASISGLKVGAEVDLAGIRVGTVRGITLDQTTFTADVRFVMDDRIKLPKDSILTIGSGTMTGGTSLVIVPGKDRDVIADKGTIAHTQDATSLEQQVSNYIFGSLQSN